MKIFFDPDFDSGYWPGPLYSNPARTSAAGEPWVGPYLLQRILETALGLSGLDPTSSERTIAFAQVILAREGFWSASAEKDPIGVARTLLRWIDWLKMHGWNGEPPSSNVGAPTPRLTDLSQIAAGALRGMPDSLSAIIAALEKRRPDLSSIESFEPLDRLLPLWRNIFSRLASLGVSIKYSIVPVPVRPNPASDLRRALSPDFAPAGDGSLILFRPPNPLDAAESVAAWLWSLADASPSSSSPSSPSSSSSSPAPNPDTVVISPHVVLDEALRRFGLPAIGARELTNDMPSLQVLPLVLAMGWDPPDPQRALELLLLPNGPIPFHIARRLRSALQQWPAVGSPDWARELGSGLDTIADPVYRNVVRERLASIFCPHAPIHSSFPVAALKLRARTVKTWAAERLQSAFPSTPSTPSVPSPKPLPPEIAEQLTAVIAQCDSFEKLLDLSGFSAFTEPQLLKLNAEIAGSHRSPRRHSAQVGYAAVASPAAVAGPARRIIWWDFTLDSAPNPFSLPLSRTELAALESIGVALTPAAELASDDARRRRRPFDCAAETLLLVCPRFGEDGEERHHHPLWDEVTARKAENANLSLLEKRQLPPVHPLPTRIPPLLPIPSPRRTWTVSPEIITTPVQHSPTSLQSLIGCPFQWTLKNLGHLKDPEIAALTDSGALIGSLSHQILADVLRSAPPDGPSARALAARLFDDLGPRLAAPLFLPGAPVELSFARQATADAAADLVAILKKSGLRVVDVESPASIETETFELKGRPDLVVGDPPVIIDLKWSGESYHRDRLKNGTAAQLAAYAFIKKTSSDLPPVAYFIIRNQRLIAQQNSPFAASGIESVDGPSVQETWAAFLATTLDRLDAVKNGKIDALAVPLTSSDDSGAGTGVGDDALNDTGIIDKDTLSDERLALTAPCKFCSFGYLCGLDWENAR